MTHTNTPKHKSTHTFDFRFNSHSNEINICTQHAFECQLWWISSTLCGFRSEARDSPIAAPSNQLRIGNHTETKARAPRADYEPPHRVYATHIHYKVVVSIDDYMHFTLHILKYRGTDCEPFSIRTRMCGDDGRDGGMEKWLRCVKWRIDWMQREKNQMHTLTLALSE